LGLQITRRWSRTYRIFSGFIWGSIHEEVVGEWPINLETFSKKRRYYMPVFILLTPVSMCWCPNSVPMQWKLLHYLYNDMKPKTPLQWRAGSYVSICQDFLLP
jgi:hypothetical protein